ncbi:MAG: LptF/LptG family permease [Candidatus Dependentiae bacterium]
MTRFVLQQLLWRFAAIYGLLLAVFLSVHYLLTLRTLPACLLTPQVIALLVPRLSVFAFPLAVVASIGMCIDWLYLTDQYLIFISLSALQQQWRRILFAVSLGSGLVYFIICGWLSPLCYQWAKREMIAQTNSFIKKLPAGQLHELGQQCRIGWERKSKDGDTDLLHRVRLLVTRAGAPTQLVSARVALLEEAGLRLRDGSIVQVNDAMRQRGKRKKESIIQHTFGELWLSYDWSGVRSDDGRRKVAPRLQAITTVLQGNDKESRHEIGLRVASGVWMWWLPWLLVAVLPRGGRRRGSAAWAAGGIATGLFCVLYVMATVTGVVWQHSALWGSVLLLVPVSIGILSFPGRRPGI